MGLIGEGLVWLSLTGRGVPQLYGVHKYMCHSTMVQCIRRRGGGGLGEG